MLKYKIKWKFKMHYAYSVRADFKNPSYLDDVHRRIKGHYSAQDKPVNGHAKRLNSSLFVSPDTESMLEKALADAAPKHNNTRVKLVKLNGK